MTTTLPSGAVLTRTGEVFSPGLPAAFELAAFAARDRLAAGVVGRAEETALDGAETLAAGDEFGATDVALTERESMAFEDAGKVPVASVRGAVVAASVTIGARVASASPVAGPIAAGAAVPATAATRLASPLTSAAEVTFVAAVSPVPAAMGTPLSDEPLLETVAGPAVETFDGTLAETLGTELETFVEPGVMSAGADVPATRVGATLESMVGVVTGLTAGDTESAVAPATSSRATLDADLTAGDPETADAPATVVGATLDESVAGADVLAEVGLIVACPAIARPAIAVAGTTLLEVTAPLAAVPPFRLVPPEPAAAATLVAPVASATTAALRSSVAPETMAGVAGELIELLTVTCGVLLAPPGRIVVAELRAAAEPGFTGPSGRARCATSVGGAGAAAA